MRIWSGVVAAVLAATAVGDGAAVVHLRSVERQAVAAQNAREAQEVDAAYRAAVLTVARQSGSARAPVTDLNALYGTEPDDDVPSVVSFDVLVHGAVAADLDDALQAMAGVQPPSARFDLHGRLTRALERMRAAAIDLADPDDDEIGAELRAFLSAGKEFDQAVAVALGESAIAVSTDGLATDQLTRAGVLYRWSLSCTRALAELEALPEFRPQDREATAAGFDAQADILRRTADLLLVPAGPERDSAQLERDVRSPLRAVLTATDSMRQLGVALRARDVGALEQAVVALDRADASFEASSRGLQAYGSSACAGLFDAGILREEQQQPDDDTSST